MSQAVVSLHGVSFDFGGPPVLEGIDLDIDEGEFLGVVGPNGSGKSTLLKIMLGLLEPTAGTVRVFGRAPRSARREIGYVPQFAGFPRDFPVSVEQAVLLGRLGRTRTVWGYRQDDRVRARRALEEVGIAGLGRRPLSTLSGGQLQRTLLARALVAEPRLLLLDEPTASVDQRAEEDIFDLLKTLHRRMSIVVVSHDVAFISAYITRVACVNRTLVTHATEEFTGELVQSLYGQSVHMIRHEHGERGPR